MSVLIGILLIAGLLIGIVLFKDYCDKKDNERIMQEEHERAELKQREHDKLMADIKRQMQVMEVLRQAKLVGDKETEADVLNGEYDGEMPEELSNCMWTSLYNNLTIINIAGINYRGNLSSYVGDFNGVMVPEPKNDYDPNAIMIKCEDGKHLGYIPESLTDMVREIVGEDFQRYRITGHIYENDDDDHKYFTGYINIVA